MIRWYVDNRRSPSGRRPQRNPDALADGAGGAAGPGHRPVRAGGAATARPRVRARAAGRPARHELLDDRRACRPGQPDGLQHLLAGAVWDHDKVRDDIRDWLVEYLADPAGVLVVEETGDLKRVATPSGCNASTPAPPARSTTPRWPSTWPTPHRRARGDRPGAMPSQGWTDDPARCRAAGVPDQVGFAAKPELARRMLERTLEAGVPAGWVTADEVYGNSPALPGWLEGRQLPYVLAVKATEPLPSPCGRRRRRGWPPRPHPSAGCGSAPVRAPRAAAGMGGPGCRWPARARPPGGAAGCWSAAADAPGNWPTTCAPARPACRWSTWSGWPGPAGGWRRRLQASKGLCGLDQHQVRRWRSWYRRVTLAMLAYGFLVVAAVTDHARHPPPLGLIPLTCNEIQHLFATLVAVPVADRGHRLRWSWWRRRCQARARACHDRRQTAQQP